MVIRPRKNLKSSKLPTRRKEERRVVESKAEESKENREEKENTRKGKCQVEEGEGGARK